MKTLIILALLTVRILTHAQTNDALADRRFLALAQIESNDQDIAPLDGGDVGRFQIRPSVWLAHTKLPLSAAANPFTSLNIAKTILDPRIQRFTARQHRPPTNAEWFLLWHRPSRVFNPRPAEAERARRFDNLCTAKDF